MPNEERDRKQLAQDTAEERLDLAANAAALVTEVKSLKTELEQAEVRRKSQSIKSWIAIALLVIGLLGIGGVARTIDTDAKARSIQNCENLNEAKVATRNSFNGFVDILISSGADTPRTPEEEAERQASIKKFKADYEKRIAQDLPVVDCAKHVK